MTWNKYSEFSVGDESKRRLLANICAACGFEYVGNDVTIVGLSGLKHRFEAVGNRGSNILLISGGAEDVRQAANKRKGTPRERMESWRDAALLASYDVLNALQANGYITDLMFFQNVNTKLTLPFTQKKEPVQWIRDHGLNSDVLLTETMSIDPVETLASEELAVVAASIGASFLSLDNLSVEEIAQLTRGPDAGTVKIAEQISRRLRLNQYFSPPTDEMLITSYGLSGNQDRELVGKIFEMALALGHQPSRNVLVPEVDFRDPIETVKALEKHKYIEYERVVEVTSEGRKVTETIRKTAQGSFIIRLLQNIGLADLAKGIVEGLGKLAQDGR